MEFKIHFCYEKYKSEVVFPMTLQCVKIRLMKYKKGVVVKTTPSVGNKLFPLSFFLPLSNLSPLSFSFCGEYR